MGQALSPPVIRAARQAAAREAERAKAEMIIVDCPPGTACGMVTAVRGSDYVILVAEPTPFGLHDLRLAVETVRQMCIPFGVVINRCDWGYGGVDEYCAGEGIAVLMKIPHSREVAEAYSRGVSIVEASEQSREMFRRLYAELLAKRGGA